MGNNIYFTSNKIFLKEKSFIPLPALFNCILDKKLHIFILHWAMQIMSLTLTGLKEQRVGPLEVNFLMIRIEGLSVKSKCIWLIFLL